MRDLMAVLRNRNIGLLLGGRFVSSTGDWLYQIALSLAIYTFSGSNAFYVGLLWIVRLVPAVVLGPYIGGLSDRLGHRRSMIIADLGRLVVIGVLAFTLNDQTWVSVYPLAFLNTVLGSLFRPASVAIIPSLVDSAEERLAANASIMQSESLAGVIGSAIGGVVASHSITAALVIDALTFIVSAASVALLRIHAPAETPEEEESEGQMGGGFMAGARLLASRPILVFTVIVMALPELASGADLVWIVPYAEKALGQGDAWIGYLFSALGLGALVGGFIAAALSGAIRLDRMLALSVFVGGVALVGFGAAGGFQLGILALAAMLVIGLAETVEYAAYETLIQQAVPESMIGRAVGTMDSAFLVMMLIGTAISGPLASTVGTVPSIIVLGALIVITTAGAWLYLQRQTAGRPDADALARIPAFAQVPGPVCEWAVRRMERDTVPAGSVIMRQGEAGDRFYTITGGRVEVVIVSGGESTTRELGPGEFFGEIALLQNVPRTATVRALEPTTLWSMNNEDFQDLRRRAKEFDESLWETANARLQASADFTMALAARP